MLHNKVVYYHMPTKYDGLPRYFTEVPMLPSVTRASVFKFVLKWAVITASGFSGKYLMTVFQRGAYTLYCNNVV